MHLLLLASVMMLTTLDLWADTSKGYQFDMIVGQDNPDSSSDRAGAATLARFAISSRPRAFRWLSSFTGLMGGGLTQGEFAIGPRVYPFAQVGRSPVQPFIGLEAALGLGTYSDVLRYDAGYGIQVGGDFLIGSSGGLVFMIEQHNATEAAQRLWLGFFYQGR